MTYPPQPGQPQGQPDPFGQGGPQSGGFPQQGGQYGQQDPYGQQQFGQPDPTQQFGQQGADPYGQQGQFGQQQFGQQGADPYGQQGFAGYPSQGGGGFGVPPKKKKTGLWIGLTALVVAVAAFAITAFVAPGFLLGDDQSDPKATAQSVVDAANAKDVDRFNKLLCPGVKGVDGGGLTGDAGGDTNAKVTGDAQTTDKESKVPFEVTNAGKPVQLNMVLNKDGDKWCYKSAEPVKGQTPPGPPTSSSKKSSSSTSSRSGSSTSRSSSGSGSGDTAAAQSTIDQFLGAVNSKNEAAASAMFCPSISSSDKSNVPEAITANSNLHMENASPASGGIYGDVKGTYEGRAADGMVSAKPEGGKMCIDVFMAF